MRKFIISILSFVIFTASAKVDYKDGDVVNLIGDSITQAGTYVMVYGAYNALHNPTENVTMMNCGIVGNNVYSMISRYSVDIAPHKANYSFIMTGMNDMWSNLYSKDAELTTELIEKRKKADQTYQQGVEKLVKMVIDGGSTPILMTPTPFDETAVGYKLTESGKSEALVRCSDFIKSLATKRDLVVVDQNTLLLEINSREQKSNPKFTIVGPDRVHPQDSGHFAMAYEIIRTLHAPSVVSEVHIDAQHGKVVKRENCDVEYQGGLTFGVTSNSLPFPITQRFADVQRLISFEEEYNREILCVIGLDQSCYSLEIDGVKVGEYSDTELSNGVNLASNNKTPQYSQALDVFRLCEERQKNQALLRDIANLEIGKLDKYRKSTGFNSFVEFLYADAEKSKGKSWYEYGKSVVRRYEANKSREAEILAYFNNLQGNIYKKAQPKLHTYKLQKL